MNKTRIATGHNDSEEGYVFQKTLGNWHIDIKYYETWGRVEHPTDEEIESLLDRLRAELKQIPVISTI